MASTSRAHEMTWLLVSALSAGCYQTHPAVVTSTSEPWGERRPDQDTTSAKIGVRDGTILVHVERIHVCARWTKTLITTRAEYREGTPGPSLKAGGGLVVGGVGMIAASGPYGALFAIPVAIPVIIVGAGVVFVGGTAAAIADEPEPALTTKVTRTNVETFVCGHAPVADVAVSVVSLEKSTLTDATGWVRIAVDEATWATAPLTLSIDVPGELSRTVRVTRDGLIHEGEDNASPADGEPNQ